MQRRCPSLEEQGVKKLLGEIRPNATLGVLGPGTLSQQTMHTMYVLLNCYLHFREILNPSIWMLLKGKRERGSSAAVLSSHFVRATLKC